MRLVSYNILDGGEGRADPLAEVMLAQRPDIVAIVEADNLSVIERIATRLNMDFIHAPGTSEKAAALLSRWPIARTINHALLGRAVDKGFLEADVAEPDSDRTWKIGVVHLHAQATEDDERQREQQVQAVLDVFAAHRNANRAHLLAGDFNANAPYQKIDPARCKPSTQKAWRANGGNIPRRVVQRILDAGYIDTLRAADPAASESAGSFSTQHPGQRVDYIFAFGFEPSRIRNAWIETDRLAKYASDHFPIGLEIA